MKKCSMFGMLVLGLLSFAVKAQKLYSYPIGAQGYTFRNHFPKDPIKTLDIIQGMGITELETGGVKGLTLEEFKAQCDKRGISIPSTGVNFDDLEKDLTQVIANAKTLGAKFIMCAWIPHKGTDFTFEDAQKAVKAFNRAGKIFKENGITFCYHDHGYEFHQYEDGTYLDYIIKNTNPEYVSFEMDVLWTMHGGGQAAPVQLLKKYPNRFKLMHVKDLKKGVVGNLTGGTPAENDVPVGTGQGDWKTIIKLAKKNGIKHMFIEDESEHELEYVPLSIKYLQSL